MFFGRDLVAQLGGQALPPPAVAQGDGHRALGRGLPDDVAVQLRHDLAGGQASVPQSSELLEA